MIVGMQGSGDPGHMDGGKRTPPLKPPRLHRPLKILDPILELGGHITATGSNDMETKEAEPKAPAKEEQLIDEKPCPKSTSEGQVGHMPEGHSRPSETVAMQGFVEPLNLVGHKRIPPKKPSRLHRPLKISELILERGGHISATGSNDMETEEVEPKVGIQEAEQAPDSAAVQHLEELDAGSDQDDIPGQEGYPSPGVIQYPAATLAAAVQSWPGCAASADLREAPSHLPEESSLESGLVPTTGEELLL
ncbi:uncharacterized protein LOC128627507 [Artibeus jamaicensis]|uniref:uncharacterized protein LOC128627507 n=1 Tax=Artibeus jamaicensis TaxID=9417 RepID=UPI00235AEEB8|nr:uncharacterized protein LOC128627507 [Artibeus jamaicensis]